MLVETTACQSWRIVLRHSGSFHCLDQSFAETKDSDQTAQLWSQLESSLTNHCSSSSLASSAAHRWIRHISLFIFELAKKRSDFHSSKLNR